ncbi:MAG: hypothetical protein IKT72_03685, partial [Clostridia bacterium]|nr:hypothetical protein [Clostridia bacterium]
MAIMLNSEVERMIYNSPWKNTYWFARMLLNSDQYGSLGKKDSLLTSLVLDVERIIEQPQLSEDDRYKICANIIRNKIVTSAKEGSKSALLYNNFVADLFEELHTLTDIIVFITTIKYIVQPTNHALNNVPNDDITFSRQTAKDILDTFGKEHVGKIISVWDTLGVRGCLDVERRELVCAFTKLRSNLQSIGVLRSELEDNVILTAFVQEFERRAGQKRKSRAGNSLEDISTFIFRYYGFKSHERPEHFQTDIEIDKWFRCKDGWSIGISCKRTLRERWKQVSSADENALSQHKIKEIWHLITYDRDLSDDKITMLGRQRQVFYLDADSPTYKRAKKHIGMCKYVRPLNQLIDDIAREQKGEHLVSEKVKNKNKSLCI